MDAVQGFLGKLSHKMDIFGKDLILVVICSTFLPLNKCREGFGKSILVKAGKYVPEYSMGLLVYQLSNGYVLPVKRALIHSKDAVNFSNPFMIV